MIPLINVQFSDGILTPIKIQPLIPAQQNDQACGSRELTQLFVNQLLDGMSNNAIISITIVIIIKVVLILGNNGVLRYEWCY